MFGSKRRAEDLRRAEEIGFLSGRLYEIDGHGSKESEKLRETLKLFGTDYQRRYPRELGTNR